MTASPASTSSLTLRLRTSRAWYVISKTFLYGPCGITACSRSLLDDTIAITLLDSALYHRLDELRATPSGAQGTPPRASYCYNFNSIIVALVTYPGDGKRNCDFSTGSRSTSSSTSGRTIFPVLTRSLRRCKKPRSPPSPLNKLSVFPASTRTLVVDRSAITTRLNTRSVERGDLLHDADKFAVPRNTYDLEEVLTVPAYS